MNYKNTWTIFTNANRNRESIEDLLLNIESENKNKDNINFNKYKNRILNAVTEELMLEKIKKEDKKDIYCKHRNQEKKSNSEIKKPLKWCGFLIIIFLLHIFFITYTSYFELPIYLILMLSMFLCGIFFSTRSYIKSINQEFIFNRNLRKDKKTILLDTNIKKEINDIFESIITKKDTIKNELASYILEEKNIKNIENKIKNKIIYQHKKDMENKLIKEVT